MAAVEVLERRVEFYSEGDRISAILYLPADASEQNPVPGVVLCHGFTGIKELILPDYGRGFARAGLAALAFDYRGFGGSEGTRGRLVARRQIEDIHNSVTFLETLAEVDPRRVGLWGTSYGAANAIVAAAADLRVRCVSAQVGFADGGRRMRERPPEETAPVRALIEDERRRRVLTGQSTMVDPLQVLNDTDTVAFFAVARQQLSMLSEPISMEFMESIFEHRPIAAVDALAGRPLLLVAAEFDTMTPASEFEALFAAASEPKRLVVIPGIRHYQIYSGEPLQRSIAESAGWFSRYLSPVTAAA
jgi:fermentation-respiration switch protein FrsA (DUF1100 family)